MNASEETPVLIVGAGPSGLTAALELSRRGVPVRLVEKRGGPSPLSRAVGLMPGSMAIFRECGVEDAIRSEALETEALDVWHADRFVGRINMNGHKDPAIRLFCLPQDRTEAILAEGLFQYGASAEYERTFEGLTEEDGQVLATVDGEVRPYAAVLGCDGSRSSVRRVLGVNAEGHDLEDRWSIADIDVPDWDDARFRVSILPDGDLVFLIPMARGRFRIVATQPDALAANPIPLPDHTVRRAGDFRIGIRQVPAYGKGLVWLAGDAAHTHSPVGGRGMNLGIADASEWARRLVDQSLDEYSASRHAVGKATIDYTEGVRKTLQKATPIKRRAFAFAAKAASAASIFHPKIVEAMVTGEF